MSRSGLPRSLTLRIAGDAGDGIPFLGQRVAQLLGRTMPSLLLLADPPAEIRAPVGALSGALSFQVRCGEGVTSASEPVDLLVALGPAALQLARPDLRPGALVLLHAERFPEGSFPPRTDTAGTPTNPVWADFRVWPLPITSWNRAALASRKLSHPESDRCQNFFVLGLLAWILALPLDPVQEWLRLTFVRKPEMAEASERALLAGLAQAQEVALPRWPMPAVSPPTPGNYRLLSGGEALTLGLLTAAQAARRTVLVAAAPSQATAELMVSIHEAACDALVPLGGEDDTGAIGTALGAAYGGGLGVAISSGPGLSLQSELLGLAVLTELPLVVLHVQHGGPALALPRHVEQADLAAALHGRTGSAPLVVLAQATPAEGVGLMSEALDLATQWMTPVVLLSDVHLLRMAEMTRVPDGGVGGGLGAGPEAGYTGRPVAQPPALSSPSPFANGEPYRRDDRGVRPWVTPGQAGLEHCLSGLERAPESGRVSFDPDDHARQTAARAARFQRLQLQLPPAVADGDPTGVLLLAWGSTYGPVREAVGELLAQGQAVAHAHLRHLHPLPANLPTLLGRHRAVLVVELNEGQLAAHLQAVLGLPVHRLSRPGGAMFSVAEIVDAVRDLFHRLAPGGA